MASGNQSPSGAQNTTPEEILARALQRATAHLDKPFIGDNATAEKIQYLVRNLQNRSGSRALLACALMKVYNPSVDIRKPYTEIGDPDSYSGRTADERYIDPFVRDNSLPCNSTTAWLTPAWRNLEATLTRNITLVGTPRDVYRFTIDLLNDVYEGALTADDLLAETVRNLILLRDEQRQRMETLLAEIGAQSDSLLSAEDIVTLVQQHLAVGHSSRLPVLVVAAAYETAAPTLGEQARTLQRHNTADKQTGALGDVEITLLGATDILTAYEMKDKRVERSDLDNARAKIIRFYSAYHQRLHNYIFITTAEIDREIADYARSLYETTGGVEFVVLDCIGFLRFFLHLFHRKRLSFLDAYQRLVLSEPESAVSQPLKEAFLALRRATESRFESTSLELDE